MNNFQSSYQFKPDGFVERNAAYEDESRRLAAQRRAKVNAYKATNRGVTAGDIIRFEQKLEAADKVALAPLASDVRQAQIEEESMREGFDPKTGNRITDLWGGNITNIDGGELAAVRHDIPGTMTVDRGKWLRNTLEPWGKNGLNPPRTLFVGPEGAKYLAKKKEGEDMKAKEVVDNEAAFVNHNKKLQAEAKQTELGRNNLRDIYNEAEAGRPVAFDPRGQVGAALNGDDTTRWEFDVKSNTLRKRARTV